MSNIGHLLLKNIVPPTPKQKQRIICSPYQYFQYLFHNCMHRIFSDSYARKCIFFAVLLLCINVTSIIFYYLNHPQPELNPDTPAYLHVVARMQAHPYLLVDTWRLPVYPFLIVLVYALTGQGNLLAVSIVQAGLFTLTTLEIYCIALLLLRRPWLAFLIGLLVGTNIVILSYIKPILSEGLAMCLLTTLVFTILYFMRTLHAKHFWLVVICFLLLLFTRPEWEYLPIPLFAYLLLVGPWRRLLRHILIAVVFIYALVGIYISINAVTNSYAGFTAIENFNLMGKVLQYHMWNEVSPEYLQESHQLSICVAHIDIDPYHVLPCVPSLSRNYNARAGAFARDVIIHHPVEFSLKSTLAFFPSLTTYYDNYPSDRTGRYEWALGWLKATQRWLYNVNALFTPCAIVWFVLLLRRKTRRQQVTRDMGVIVLVVFYALAITTLAGYRFDDYMRVHTVFDPLLILIISTSLFLGIRNTVLLMSRKM